MSRFLLAGAAAFAAVALVPHTAALAQDDITVRAPQPGPRTNQPRSGIKPPQQYVAKSIVQTYDLDLRTEYGRYMLDRRIEVAADQVCDRLDNLVPDIGPGGPSTESRNCRSNVLRAALADARAAAWNAG